MLNSKLTDGHVVGLVTENSVDNTRDVRPLQDLSSDGLSLIYFKIYAYFSRYLFTCRHMLEVKRLMQFAFVDS